MKKQATVWKEIFADHISDKGLISTIWKNSPNSGKTKQNKNNLEIVKRHEQTFP